MSKLKSFIFIFLCLFFVTCLEINDEVTVNLLHLNSKQAGKKGIVAIEAIPSDKFSEDTSRKIYFQTQISNGAKTFDVDCGFSKPREHSFFVFCNLKTDIPAGNYSIDFTGVSKFDYQGHNISFTNEKFEFVKLDKDYINLYSDKQIINIVEGKNSYDLKFNIESFNQETVMLGTEPMDCKQENNELVCQIKKDELEKDLAQKEEKRIVKYFSDVDTPGAVQLPFVGEIIIKDNITQKTDVFIGITKLIQNIAEGESFIAYETNITNFDKVISEFIELDFVNENTGSIVTVGCSIRKYEINPLLITCVMNNDGIYHLKEINEEIQFIKAHLRYNFRIQPVKNEEKIYLSDKNKGTWILWLCPKVLDFTKNNPLYIYYKTEHSVGVIGATFNEEKGDLSCEKRENGLLRCTVPESHFEGKKSGYYFTKHTNHMKSKSAAYESSPIKVILKDSIPSKGSIHSISLYYLLLLFAIML